MSLKKCGCNILELVKKVAFTDFVKGLSITLRYNLSKSITHRYPDTEKWVPFRRFRGMHTLNVDEKGRELCVACELCSKACPTSCITVIPMEDNSGRGIADRVAKVWKIDLVRCLFCGYCEDACPTTAVRLGREYELACTEMSCTKREKTELLKPQPIPEDIDGGFLVKSSLDRTGGKLRVVPELSHYKKRQL